MGTVAGTLHYEFQDAVDCKVLENLVTTHKLELLNQNYGRFSRNKQCFVFGLEGFTLKCVGQSEALKRINLFFIEVQKLYPKYKFKMFSDILPM